MEFLTGFLLKWGGIVALAVVLAERIARLTPNETDNMVIEWVRKILRTLGVDFPDVDTYEAKKPTEVNK